MIRKIFIWVVIIAALIWIPIGTPDDIITTTFFVKSFGWPIFILGCVILIGLLYYLGVFHMLKAVLF